MGGTSKGGAITNGYGVSGGHQSPAKAVPNKLAATPPAVRRQIPVRMSKTKLIFYLILWMNSTDGWVAHPRESCNWTKTKDR